MNNNALKMQFMDILRRGDTAAGEALANQILQQNGLSQEQGVQQAQQWLNQNFSGNNPMQQALQMLMGR